VDITHLDALPERGPLREQALNEVEAAIKRLPFLVLSIVLMTVIAVSRSLAQDTVGSSTQGSPGQSSSISLGFYGTGLYAPGITGPGSYGPGSYGPGSYGPGMGASTGPGTPFGTFSAGGAAAGTAVPTSSARSR
jgi:hypothetical protein